MSEFDQARLNVQAGKLTRGRDEIIRLFAIRFPTDPLVVALAADEATLAELKASIAKKSRANDYAASGVG